MRSSPRPAPPADPTRDRLKSAAQRLFAERGIDGVSIRDIVAAAGARNGASIHYYFRSKEMLVRELVVDGARRIDDRRNAALDRLEASGGPRDVAEVARLLVETSIEPSHGNGEGSAASGYLRFIASLQSSHRELFLEALENRWNSGYLRCLRHLERLLDPMPQQLLNQRLIFMSLHLGATLAAREAAIERPEASNKLWRTPWALDNLIDSLCGLLGQPPSRHCFERLQAGPATRSRRLQGNPGTGLRPIVSPRG